MVLRGTYAYVLEGNLVFHPTPYPEIYKEKVTRISAQVFSVQVLKKILRPSATKVNTATISRKNGKNGI